MQVYPHNLYQLKSNYKIGKIQVSSPLSFLPYFVHNGQTFFLPQFHSFSLWHIQMRDINKERFG